MFRIYNNNWADVKNTALNAFVTVGNGGYAIVQNITFVIKGVQINNVPLLLRIPQTKI